MKLWKNEKIAKFMVSADLRKSTVHSIYGMFDRVRKMVTLSPIVLAGLHVSKGKMAFKILNVQMIQVLTSGGYEII